MLAGVEKQLELIIGEPDSPNRSVPRYRHYNIRGQTIECIAGSSSLLH